MSQPFFEVMGVPLAMGRSFSAAEDQADGPAAIIVSHRFWQTRLSADPDVLGRTVPMDGQAVPIVPTPTGAPE